ncbi:hypothetical protein AB0K09_19535 [Streptomyces sp. NPDC049577]|uniref:hypothetical protein n=1 Tax=Streptomyces sp. NPDC049577 TaxID=3155153 RepID=UPI003431FC7C
MVSLTGTIDPQYEGRLACTGLVKSPTRANTAVQHSDSAATDVELPLISVTPVINAGWEQGWPGTGW